MEFEVAKRDFNLSLIEPDINKLRLVEAGPKQVPPPL